MTLSHAIVWMDSREAHVYRFDAQDVEQKRLKAHMPFRKMHHKAGVIGAGRAAADLDFFDRIIDSLRGTREWILAGPGEAKQAFLNFLDKYRAVDGHMTKLSSTLARVEAMDHPTDGELLKHARQTFKAIDRLQSNSPPPP
jgi:stalled ribosome rescue protein Dom34